MKITFVLPGYPWRPVGAYRVVYEYADQLVRHKHQVTVVHPRRMQDELGIWAPRSLSGRLRRHARNVRNLLFVPRVRWQPIDGRVRMLYVKELTADAVPEADAVFATAWDTVEYVCRYPASKGAKFHLVQSYDYWSHLEGQTAATWRCSLNKVVISKWLRDKMAELGCKEMAYIPNAVNHANFRLVKPIAERPKRVAMLFSLIECKGSQDGLRALEIAKQKHPDLRAVLFGIPKKPRDLPGWIEYFQNPTPHDLVHDVYNASSIYLCPSIREASPLPPAEAMACGCALVTTECGGTAEYSEHGITALFSPPGRPEALARNLSDLLANSPRRVQFAQEGHRRIRELDWEHCVSKLLDFVRSRTRLSEGDNVSDASVASSIRAL